MTNSPNARYADALESIARRANQIDKLGETDFALLDKMCAFWASRLGGRQFEIAVLQYQAARENTAYLPQAARQLREVARLSARAYA